MAAYNVASLALHVYDVGLGFLTSEKTVHSIGISLLVTKLESGVQTPARKEHF